MANLITVLSSSKLRKKWVLILLLFWTLVDSVLVSGVTLSELELFRLIPGEKRAIWLNFELSQKILGFTIVGFNQGKRNQVI